MKNWIPRWFESNTEKEARDEQGRPSVYRSTVTTDELEQRLISEADSWVQQYKQAARSPDVQLRSRESQFDSRAPVRSHNRQRVQVFTILAVGLAIVLGVRPWLHTSPQQTTSVGQHKTQLEYSRPSDVEIRSLVASAHAVNEICGKVAFGFRQRSSSPQTQQVDIDLESSLANAAEHLKQPGRQYGRTLAWIEHRLQLRNSSATDSTGDRSD